MNSPFPGMDPYLEDPAVWEEFHHVFVTECMYFLSERLPEGYVAKIGERVELIGLNDEAARQYVPDTAVALGRGRQQELRTTTEPAAEPAATTATLVADPITIPAVHSVDVREGYVEILRMPGHDLVTSIELLSPWNKYGEGIGEYRHKRRAVVAGAPRGGDRPPAAGDDDRTRPPVAGGGLPRLRVPGRPPARRRRLRLGAHDALPPIRVPLRGPDPDVALELAAVVRAVYDKARYRRKLTYAGPPPAPRLSPADAAWADHLLKAAGRR